MPWAKVSILEASHFDPNTAYAAINTLRLDDLRPHILRTRDGGRTWTEITRGLPHGGAINAVREDTQRRGLLFAGSEQAVYVSFDDGENWQSLRLNMPATSIRDLVIKDADLIAGTHGRGFWILDDITPLRQITPDITQGAGVSVPARRPRGAFRWNKNTDTPLPPDEPAAPNPPDGVDHQLSASDQASAARSRSRSSKASTGEVLRTLLERRPAGPARARRATFRTTGFARPQKLSTAPGLHRFVWDVRYAPPAVDELHVSDRGGRAQHAEGAARRVGDARTSIRCG